MSFPILSPDECRTWDQRAERAGIGLGTLMDAAGRAAAQVLAARFGHRLPGGVLVATGLLMLGENLIKRLLAP